MQSNRDGTPSVSVVIPTVGRPEELERAVESVLGQSYPAREIVIVDDNRQDEEERKKTYRIAESALHKTAIQVVEHTGLPGGAAGRNAGAVAATGDLLAFLDDDDWWESDKLSRQIMAYQNAARHGRVGLVYTGLRVVDDRGKTLRHRPGWLPKAPLKSLARQNFVGTVSSALIPRETYDAIGGFDEELPARQDLDLWIRIASNWGIVAVEQCLTVYVNHSHGISKNFEKKMRAHDLFLAKHRTMYEDDPSLLAHYHYATALLCLKHRRKDLARTYLRRSMKARPTKRALIRWMLPLH